MEQAEQVLIRLTAPVTHDGTTSAAGETLSLTPAQADRLVRLGCGMMVSGSAAEKPADSAAQESGDMRYNPPDGEEDGDDGDNTGTGLPVFEQLPVKDMTREELGAELTAAGIEVREGASHKVLSARVTKLRETGA